MKPLLLVLSLVFITSCASHKKHHKKSSKHHRTPSSVSYGDCAVEKHAKNDWYRLMHKGSPVHPDWYTKDQVDIHLKLEQKKGMCK